MPMPLLVPTATDVPTSLEEVLVHVVEMRLGNYRGLGRVRRWLEEHPDDSPEDLLEVTRDEFVGFSRGAIDEAAQYALAIENHDYRHLDELTRMIAEGIVFYQDLSTTPAQMSYTILTAIEQFRSECQAGDYTNLVKLVRLLRDGPFNHSAVGLPLELITRWSRAAVLNT